MKFYVAGKWQERLDVQTLQHALIELGHEISLDWTYHTEADEGFPLSYSVEDIEGVRKCDVYVGRFLNNHNYKGALVEMGAALALNKIVCIIGRAIDSCLFAHHPFVMQFETQQDFLDLVGTDDIMKMDI